MKYTMDNGSNNNFIKLTISINDDELECELKKIKCVKWITPTKLYGTFKKRFLAQGSKIYDEIIKELYFKGYNS